LDRVEAELHYWRIEGKPVEFCLHVESAADPLV
jgi:hypothetical protein